MERLLNRPVTPHHPRLTVLFGGRPFDFGPMPKEMEMPQEFLLSVHHENGQHHVDLGIASADLSIPDHEFRERFVEPVTNTLDGAAYPERQKRFLDATKEYARHVARSANGQA